MNWQPVTIALAALTPWERNPKRISRSHAKRLLDLWDKLGQFQTIAIGPGGEVYDGHQRLSVLLAAYGKDYQVQALQAPRALTEEERQELTIAAHVGTVGQFDWDALAGWDAGALQGWGLDGETLGNWRADVGALDAMLAAEKEAPEDVGPQIDRAEELRQKWGVEPGQLWQLGEHRLICGDCTDREVVERVMGGEVGDLLLTDPPYGINLDTDLSEIKTDWKGWKGQGGKYAPVIGDDKAFDPSTLFRDFGDCQEMFLWGADYYADAIPDRQTGSWLVWDKRVNQQDKDSLSWSIGSEFELCWSKVRHKREVIRKLWSGLYGTETQDVRSRVHPTQKPVEVIEWILEKYSEQGALVVDPFLGSGTTMVAAQRLRRRCFGIEIDPGYCAVTLERMHGLGVTPVLIE